MRLYADKESLYRLASDYVDMPDIQEVGFRETDRPSDYWLDWCDGIAHLAISGGRPVLYVTTSNALPVDMLRSAGIVMED